MQRETIRLLGGRRAAGCTAILVFTSMTLSAASTASPRDASTESTQASDPSPAAPSDGAASAVLLDRVTVTATGERREADEVPLAVSVITRGEIERSGDEAVAALLRRRPGTISLRSGDEGGAGSLFLRGTESDHVLALFDGVRLNSPYFGGYDWSLMPTAGVEQIEVARGPFSALWGADAIGGVVNVIPQRAEPGTRLRLVGEAGDDDWLRLEGLLGWGDDQWDLLASYFDREGSGTLPNSDFSNRQVLVDGGYRWGDGNRAAALYQDLDSVLGIPFSSPLNLTPNRRQSSQQRLVSTPLSFQFGRSWAFELTPSLVERTLVFRDPDDPGGFTASDTFADTAQVRLASHHDLGRGGRHELSWGGEWRRDEVDAGSSFGIDLSGQRSSVSGLFAQDVWQVSQRLTVIVGARWDEADEWGSELSPRLALGLRLSDAVELRGSYGEAFRQPSIGELYFPFSGNPELDAERSRSFEVGLLSSFGGQRLEVAAFSTETTGLIDFDFASFSFANLERAEVRGVEASWAAPVSGRLLSTLQATWLDSEDQDGLELLRRPEWSGGWILGGRLGRRWRADLAVLYVGERRDVDAVTFGRTELGGHVTSDLTIGFELLPGLELDLRALNALDRDYQEVDGYPAPGRRLVAGVRWSR